jgi:hypothetical protein
MNNLETFKEIAQTLGKLPSREEFSTAFKGVLQFVKNLETSLNAKIDARLAQIKNGKDGVNGKDGKDGESIVGPRGPMGPVGRAIFGAKGDKGDPGQDGSPDTGQEIVDKINALPTEEDIDKIDAAHIKNLPDIVRTNVIATNKPLWALEDVDVSGIVSGQGIKWDGTRWIPFTPTGANTGVYNEVVSGTGTTFTLAHTPVSGTLRVYVRGQRILPTSGYTLTGAIITTVDTLATGDVTADYEY